jgi:hypothetical protein
VSISGVFAAGVVTGYVIRYRCVLSRLGPQLGPTMPRRFQPLQLAAAVIIGIMAAVIILIFYHGGWL